MRVRGNWKSKMQGAGEGGMAPPWEQVDETGARAGGNFRKTAVGSEAEPSGNGRAHRVFRSHMRHLLSSICFYLPAWLITEACV